MLVTGSSGLLGTELSRLLCAQGCLVFSGYKTHTPTLGTPIQFDLTDLDGIRPLFNRIQPEVVVHTAAMSDVDACEGSADLANRVNGEATGKIGEEANNAGSYVIYVSTDYVFDGSTGCYSEEDRPNPINRYGMSKLMGESLLNESGATYCTARTSVIYGWGRQHRPNSATWVLRRLESNPQPLKVVNDQFASPTFSLNLAEMILELVSKRWEGSIHLAGSTRISRCEFAKELARAFDFNPDLIEGVDSREAGWKARRPPDSSLCVAKAEKLLEKRPLELKEALVRFKATEKN